MLVEKDIIFSEGARLKKVTEAPGRLRYATESYTYRGIGIIPSVLLSSKFFRHVVAQSICSGYHC